MLINRNYPANYQMIVNTVRSSDTLEVLVEMTNEMFSYSLSAVAAKENERSRI